jgi:hypothetical protein
LRSNKSEGSRDSKVAISIRTLDRLENRVDAHFYADRLSRRLFQSSRAEPRFVEEIAIPTKRLRSRIKSVDQPLGGNSPSRRTGGNQQKQFSTYVFKTNNYEKFRSLEFAAVGAANAAKRAFLRFNATIGRRSKPCDPIKSNINEIPYRRNERIVIVAFGFLRSRSGRGSRREVRPDFRIHFI